MNYDQGYRDAKATNPCVIMQMKIIGEAMKMAGKACTGTRAYSRKNPGAMPATGLRDRAGKQSYVLINQSNRPAFRYCQN